MVFDVDFCLFWGYFKIHKNIITNLLKFFRMKRTRKNLLMSCEIQTPEVIRNLIQKSFPWLTDLYELGLPLLSYDNINPKERYKLVWVMAIQPRCSQDPRDVEFFCYYPMKKSSAQYKYCPATPLRESGEVFKSKRGRMKTISYGGFVCLEITNIYNVVEN